MESITAEQERQLQEAFKNRDEHQLQAEGSAAEVQAASKEAFCDNWQTIREVLSFLKQLPGVPSAPIDAVIRAGDLAHRIIC